MPRQLSLISWMGGKQRLVKQLLTLVPEHNVYCEVFGGGAAPLLNKPPSHVEILNDIDGNLANLFMVVRDRAKEFEVALRKLPYSRELYETWRRPFVQGKTDDPADAVERAVRFYYVVRSAFFSHPEKGWRFERYGSRSGKVRQHTVPLWSALTQLDEIATRLRYVYIDHVDFRRCIRNWDTPHTFFYLDPPYYGTTPHLHTFTEQDHKDLAEILRHTEGKWLLTYNDTPVIRKFYSRYPRQRVRQPLASYKPDLGEARPRWSQLLIRNYELSKSHEKAKVAA